MDDLKMTIYSTSNPEQPYAFSSALEQQEEVQEIIATAEGGPVELSPDDVGLFALVEFVNQRRAAETPQQLAAAA